MKKSRFLLLLIFLSLILPACGQGTAGQSTSGQASSAEQLTWQEQYDLGVRYLSEGNYEEAIIAFTAAIEIDPKRAPAYVGRGDAYVGSVSGAEITAQTLEFTKAEADYLAAIDLDTLTAAVYEKLADLYLAAGDVDSAIAILERGYQATGDESLNSRRQELGILGTDEVVWTDPVFERLIRDKLGLPAGPVYAQDLDEITALSIYGDSAVFIDGENGWSMRHVLLSDGDRGPLVAYYGNEAGETYTARGGITNVDTLRYFRNLYSVDIVANHITDISVLEQMVNLEYANFWANDIADLSPLDKRPNGFEHNSEQFVEIGDIIIIK